MIKSVRMAFINAVLVIILAYSVFGLRLEREGVRYTVVGADSNTLWLIGLVAVAMFIWCILRDLWLKKFNHAHVQFIPSRLKNLITLQSTQKWLVLALLVIAILVPILGSKVVMTTATTILIYVLLGLGLNIVVGLAGLLDLGYIGFYAVGAYTYAFLMNYLGFGFWASLPIAMLVAAIVGFLLGFPVLRLRGDYLAIVTLGFGEIIRILLNNLTKLTNGPQGMSVDAPTLFGLNFNKRVVEGVTTFHDFFGIKFNAEYKMIFIYLILLICVLIVLFTINRLIRMPLGRAWEALREDEIACRTLGLNPTLIKLSAFTLGASFAGLAVCIFAAKQGTIYPNDFTFLSSAMILAIVVLGGMGSQLGVILAAIFMGVLENMQEFKEYRMLIFGLSMILIMVWRPQGLLPMQRPHLELTKE